MFNILYEEKVNCRLVKSNLVEDRVLNWNRINAMICFNYLQQQFYLVSPTMKTLAAGKNSTAIIKLLKVLLNTCQGNIGDAKFLDDESLREIADVMNYEVKGDGSSPKKEEAGHENLVGDVEFKGGKASERFSYIMSANQSALPVDEFAEQPRE